jgi:hypothetical protein
MVQVELDKWCKDHFTEYTLKITDERYYEIDDMVSFQVTPEPKGIGAFDYANALSDVEISFRRDKGIKNVLLVPVIDME